MRTCRGKSWGIYLVTQVHYLLINEEDIRREVGHNLKGYKKETPMENTSLNVGTMGRSDTSRGIIRLGSKMEKRTMGI